MKPQLFLTTILASLATLSAETPNGLITHDFFYAGESKTQDIYIVKKGQIVWSFHQPGPGEISDAVLLSSGNVLYAHQFGVTLIDPAKTVLWNYDAPQSCEIHTARPIGAERVVFIQNGPEPKCLVVNIATHTTEREFPLSVGNPGSTHGQFRHAEITAAGTLLVAHMDQGKVSEYDDHGKELWTTSSPGPWSATRLPNGHTLITATSLIREVDPAGQTVWELKPADLSGHTIKSFQLATRLPNGNTLLNNWLNSWNEPADTAATAPDQAYEVTPDKKIVWILNASKDPVKLGPATTIQLLDSPSAPEKVHFGEFH